MSLRQRAIDAVRARFGRPTGLWGRAAARLMTRSEARVETKRLKPAVVCALGVNGART
jgi:hypothetical protein